MLRLSTAITVLLTLHLSFASAQSTVKFYQVITGDSVAMFFNDNYKYTDRTCATNVRFTRLDKDGNFTGAFTDYHGDPMEIRATGSYVSGKKTGLFILYYPNGKIQAKGEFLNNRPRGTWEFFRENGLPERQISVTEKDTLLIRFVSDKGDLLVDNGNGQFEGPVSGNFPAKNDVVATGRIFNGKAVGKWTSTLQGKPFCAEEFTEDGKFISGYFPGAKSKNRSYKNRSFLSNQMPADYLTSVETIAIENCVESKTHQKIQLDFNYNNFKSSLSSQLWELWTEDIRQGKYKTYQEEETHYMTIEFTVGENMRADNFKQVSSWGANFYGNVVAAIRRNAKFSGGTGKMYFHMRFISRDTHYYVFNFKFSEQPEISRYD